MAQVLDELLTPAREQRLIELAGELCSSYRAADPFPHAVIDGFLPETILDEVLRAYPRPGDIEWTHWISKHDHKLAFDKVERLSASIRDVLYFMNSAPVIRFLEELTGIQGLLPDPYFHGGGLHQIEPGGRLEVHADFNVFPQLNLHRRLNALIYLNKDWKDEYGGHLELWDAQMTSCRKRISPLFNRCVIFNTDQDSFHGHPHPLNCPEGMTRKSLATYYYTATPIDPAKTPMHTTLFQERPEAPPPAARWKKGLKKILPPVVVDIYKTFRRWV